MSYTDPCARCGNHRADCECGVKGYLSCLPEENKLDINLLPQSCIRGKVTDECGNNQCRCCLTKEVKADWYKTEHKLNDVQYDHLMEYYEKPTSELDNNQSETHKLLHILWSKAVGTEGYDKKQWQRFQQLIEK